MRGGVIAWAGLDADVPLPRAAIVYSAPIEMTAVPRAGHRPRGPVLRWQRITLSCLLHGALLAGVILFQERYVAPEPSLPEGAFQLVFAPAAVTPPPVTPPAPAPVVPAPEAVAPIPPPVPIATASAVVPPKIAQPDNDPIRLPAPTLAPMRPQPRIVTHPVAATPVRPAPVAPPTLAAPPAPDTASATPSMATAPITPARPVSGMETDRAPIYPEIARRRGEQGRVLLRVQVAADGLPTDVSVAKSSGYAALDNAALTALRQWRFVPATSGGTAIAAIAVVPIRFQLDN